eukprot:COSAG01_NODE_13232_length_1616_cov_2.297297_2_plen_198_part_00
MAAGSASGSTGGLPPTAAAVGGGGEQHHYSLTLAMALISLLSEGLYGATSFGPAITFNVGWQVLYMIGLADGTLTTVVSVRQASRRQPASQPASSREISAAPLPTRVGLMAVLVGAQTVNMTVMETMSAAMQCIVLWRLVDPALLLATALPCCGFIVLGQLLMLQLDGVWCVRLDPCLSWALLIQPELHVLWACALV